MDCLIITVTAAADLCFHWWIYWRIRRWMDRDLALSFAGDDSQKRDYLLQRLAEVRASRVKRRDLPAWLEHATADYPSREA